MPRSVKVPTTARCSIGLPVFATMGPTQRDQTGSAEEVSPAYGFYDVVVSPISEWEREGQGFGNRTLCVRYASRIGKGIGLFKSAVLTATSADRWGVDFFNTSSQQSGFRASPCGVVTTIDLRLVPHCTTTRAGHLSGYCNSSRASARTRTLEASDRSAFVSNGGVRSNSIKRSGVNSANAIWYCTPAIDSMRFEGHPGRSITFA